MLDKNFRQQNCFVMSTRKKPSFRKSSNLSSPSNVSTPSHRKQTEGNFDEIENSPRSEKSRSSLHGNIPLAERIRKYQQEANKSKDKFAERSGYREKVSIKERISMIEAKLGNKSRAIKKRRNDETNSLRVASPERALELIKRYFDAPNPKLKRKKRN